MDVSSIFSYEKTFSLDLRHPISNEPLGIVWQIRSPQSEAAKAAVRKIIDDEADQAVIGVARPRADTLEKRNAAILAAHVAGWSWGPHSYKGETPEFSAAKAAEILLAEDWIYSQVMNAKNKITNFTAG
jgi:hypothetical protein